MFPKDIYIDLGTENTIVYAKRQGILLNEPTIVAESSRTQSQVSGVFAKKMLGKTPGHFSIYKPLKEGVVIDFEHAKEMLSVFLNNSQNEMLFSRSRILISLPLKVKKYEGEVFRNLAYELGAGIVHLVSEPLAGAIGSGVNIFSKKSFMFFDLGAGTSEVIITFNGKIVKSEAVRVGGNDINEAIINIFKSKHLFCIGEQTAENIKKEIAILDTGSIKAKSLSVSGVNLLTGLPEKRVVDSTMIHSALLPTFQTLSSLLSKTFNECPPDLISDIVDSGIVLFGGNALIPGTIEFFSNNFEIPVYRATNPLMSVTIGGARILDNDPLFEELKLGSLYK